MDNGLSVYRLLSSLVSISMTASAFTNVTIVCTPFPEGAGRRGSTVVLPCKHCTGVSPLTPSLRFALKITCPQWNSIKTFHRVALWLCLGEHTFSGSISISIKAREMPSQLHTEERALLRIKRMSRTISIRRLLRHLC